MFDNHALAYLMQPGIVAALVAQLVNWRVNRDVPGIKWWSVGLALQAVGVMIRAQAPPLPELLAVPLVNLLLIGGQFILLYGLCQFAGRPMFIKTSIATLVLLLASVAYFTAVDDNLTWRTGLFTAAIGVAFALQASLLPPMAKRGGMAGVVVLLVAYGVTFLAFVTRVVMLAILGRGAVGVMHIGDSMAIASPQSLLSMGAVALATAYSYGFVLLVSSHSRWQLHQVAIVDSLTGVPNRRAFEAEMQHQVLRARRNHGRLGLALMDLDRFKQVNDEHGHAAGDALLRHFTEVVTGTLRETDFFARVGGEEFALLVGDTTIEAIHLAAERIRAALEHSPLIRPGGDMLWVTVSIGAAASVEGGGETEWLYGAADAALYRAKAGGRNRVERASPMPQTVAESSIARG